jgi:hypothetical protein
MLLLIAFIPAQVSATHNSALQQQQPVGLVAGGRIWSKKVTAAP